LFLTSYCILSRLFSKLHSILRKHLSSF